MEKLIILFNDSPGPLPPERGKSPAVFLKGG